jgi:hypothetical protein
MAVLWRGVAARFMAASLQGVAAWSMAVSLRGIARVVIAQSEQMFSNRASVPETVNLVSKKNLVSDPRVRQTGKRTGRLNETREW